MLGFWATLYRSSDRTVQHLCLWPENAHKLQFCEEFAPQPGGTNDNDAHVCEPICINMYCRANIIIKKKLPINWRKEWQKFQSCKFIHGHYFCDNFTLHCDVIRFTGMGIIVVRPPGWGANSSRNCHSCSFCSHKQRCWTFLSELWYEVASNLNTFFLRCKQRTAVKVVNIKYQQIFLLDAIFFEQKGPFKP